jgi:hypothetical protein
MLVFIGCAESKIVNARFPSQIADRLFSSIGQDTLDALFWTAAAPRQKRRIVTIIFHFGLASVYVCIFYKMRI